MFRSVDGCASSSGRRRDANQERQEEERLYEKRGMDGTLRLQHEREAAEEGARQSEEAKGVSKLQSRCSSCARVCCCGAR